MSKSNIKTFESFKKENEYIDDIEGILVELKDKGFEFDIEYSDDSSEFSISILKYKTVTRHVKREEGFKFNDVDEYLKTLVEYFKAYFKVKRIYYKVKLPGVSRYGDNDARKSSIIILDDYIGTDSLYNIEMVVIIEN
jgi:hypothetical protein